MYACQCGYKTASSKRLGEHQQKRRHGAAARRGKEWRGDRKVVAKGNSAKKSGK